MVQVPVRLDVVVDDHVLRSPGQGQHQCDEHAGAVLARGTVHEDAADMVVTGIETGAGKIG